LKLVALQFPVQHGLSENKQVDILQRIMAGIPNTSHPAKPGQGISAGGAADQNG
jgi:hypothetical protein